jgi:tRNA threonylcarbamoyladenosine biosynthesis protein TsaB
MPIGTTSVEFTPPGRGKTFGGNDSPLIKKHNPSSAHFIMNVLAIETSGSSLSVAIKKGSGPARHAFLKGFSRHVENLIPLMDRLLKKERLKIREVDTFLIGRGPGSFTGLRVGFATLKGFLAVHERPCFGAYSFDLIASTIPHSGSRFTSRENLAVCLNAKRDKLYARLYRSYRQGWKPVGAPFVKTPDDFLKELPSGTRVAGDGLVLCNQDLLKKIDSLPEKYWTPRASVLIKLYEKKDPLLKPFKRPKDFLPFYLRSSEAEERLKNKTQNQK